eukprot:11166513-Lingulodinium_polyedra.AAC.1
MGGAAWVATDRNAVNTARVVAIMATIGASCLKETNLRLGGQTKLGAHAAGLDKTLNATVGAKA